MEDKYYKWISLALGVVVIVLLAFIFTRPKPVDTLALSHDLNQFQTDIQAWNNQYGSNAGTPQAKSALAGTLTSFSQKLQNYQ